MSSTAIDTKQVPPLAPPRRSGLLARDACGRAVGGGWAAKRCFLAHECPEMTAAVPVRPAGHALPCSGARHRVDRSGTLRVQGLQASYVDRSAPGAVVLVDHERLASARRIVHSAGGAV